MKYVETGAIQRILGHNLISANLAVRLRNERRRRMLVVINRHDKNMNNNETIKR